MNETAALAAVEAAETVAENAALPWYNRLFRMPNLAMAMGGLVLIFSGVLGYLVLQNRNNSDNTVAQIDEQSANKGGPFLGSEAPAANLVASNTATALVNSAANNSVNAVRGADEVSKAPDPTVSTGQGSSQTADKLLSQPESTKDTAASGGRSVPGAPEAKPTTAAPPPPVDDIKSKAGDVFGALREEKKEKDDDVASLARKRAEDRRDMPASPAKSGPSRAVGPVQSQNQINTQTFEMPVTRTAGGKTFDNRNGAWYDRAYRNQPTNNIRRGTPEYKNLDSGLRSIADRVGGVVIVVWKEKAYRIQ